MEKRNLYKNKIFLYTGECAICGNVFPSDEALLRGSIEKAGKELVVKQVSLYHGWREEAKSLSNRFGVEVPFYYNYDTDEVVSWHEVYNETGNTYKPVEYNRAVFERFLGGKNDTKRESESFDPEENCS